MLTEENARELLNVIDSLVYQAYSRGKTELSALEQTIFEGEPYSPEDFSTAQERTALAESHGRIESQERDHVIKLLSEAITRLEARTDLLTVDEWLAVRTYVAAKLKESGSRSELGLRERQAEGLMVSGSIDLLAVLAKTPSARGSDDWAGNDA